MDSVADISFRLAGVEDHAKVIAIDPNIYDGMDYIIKEYPWTIKKPHYYGAVAEIKGKVIAYVAAGIQLENSKLCLKGARVMPELRGKGVYGKLLDYLRTLLKRKYPGLMMEEFTSPDSNPALHKLFSNPAYKAFFRRSFRNFRVRNPQSLKRLGHVDWAARDVGVEGIREILQNERTCKMIFPTRVFIGWKVYDPLLSEITLMAEEQPLVLETRRDVNILTTQASHQTMCGMLYFIQFHIASGIVEPIGVRAVAAHLHAHVTSITKISDEDILTIVIDSAFLEILEKAARLIDLESREQFANSVIGFNRII